MSFPDPFTGGEFDAGFFTELGVNPLFINQPNGAYDLNSLNIFDFIFKLSWQIGVQGGAVCNLAGKGGEVGATIPYTPIPGTSVPNPLGPTIGANATFDIHDNFTGINLEVGIGGAGIHGYGTVGTTISMRRGLSK